VAANEGVLPSIG
jgi:hypothetical protein